MNRLPPCTAALAALLLTCVGSARADRPLATNNADVHAPGSCVVEAGVERATQRGTPSAHAQTASFACGTGWATEAGLAYGQVRAAGQSSSAWSLGGKTSLVERSPTRAGWSVGWGLDWVRAPGEPLRREGSFVTGIVSTEAAAGLRLHANLGWARSRSARQDSTQWGLAVEKELGGGIELLAETFASDRERSPWINLGLRWAVVPERLFVDLAWAVQASSARPKGLTAGVRAEF